LVEESTAAAEALREREPYFLGAYPSSYTEVSNLNDIFA
jgi:hypothetical protein